MTIQVTKSEFDQVVNTIQANKISANPVDSVGDWFSEDDGDTFGKSTSVDCSFRVEISEVDGDFVITIFEDSTDADMAF